MQLTYLPIILFINNQPTQIVSTHQLIYIPTNLNKYLPNYLPTNLVHNCLPENTMTNLPLYLSTYLPQLPSYPYVHLPSYTPYQPAYQSINPPTYALLLFLPADVSIVCRRLARKSYPSPIERKHSPLCHDIPYT